MKTLILAIVLGTLASVAHAEEEFKWIKDFNEAKELAKKEDKLMFVDFYTDWCGWCKRMDRDTMSKPEVQKFLSDYIPVKIDGDRNKNVVRQYGVRGYPTLALIHHDGTPVSVMSGYKKPEQLKQAITEAVKGSDELLGLLESYEKGEATPKEKFELAQLHLNGGRLPQGMAVLQKVIDSDMDNKNGLTDDAQVLLGQVHYNMKNFGEALRHFRTAYDKYPESNVRPANLIGLAKSHAKQQQNEEALPFYKEYLEKFPGDRFHDAMKREYEELSGKM